MVGSKRSSKHRWLKVSKQYIKFGAKQEKKYLQRRFRRNEISEAVPSGNAYRKLGSDAKTNWIP